MGVLLRLLSLEFVADYVAWMVAPWIFLLPWLAIAQLFDGESGGALGFLLNPPLWTGQSFWRRLGENLLLWFVSYAFAWLCYHFGMQQPWTLRFKFNPSAPPTAFVLSEIGRSSGGILVLTLFQVFLCAPALPAEQSQELPSLRSVACWLVAIGVWADFHFYATHRFMHEAPGMYALVHKVHHRARNVDPWSGLSMHPVEHAVYFSAILPGLLVHIPFWVTNLLAVSMIAYPIPSHIGYAPFERHHYDHHTKFNYNYGSSQLWDVLCGTTYEDYSASRHGTESDAAKRRAAEAKRQQQLVMSDDTS